MLLNIRVLSDKVIKSIKINFWAPSHCCIWNKWLVW